MSSLPTFSEGLTDVGAQLGDLKFVMSKFAPGRKAEETPLTPQDRMRRAFVIQASLGFDAKEILYLIHHQKDRLPAHLKTLAERDIPWIEDLKDHLDEIIVLIKNSDALLAGDFEHERVIEILNEELGLIKALSMELQSIINDNEVSLHTAETCERIMVISKSLFPLFSRAKDALGIKKAQGAI